MALHRKSVLQRTFRREPDFRDPWLLKLSVSPALQSTAQLLNLRVRIPHGVTEMTAGGCKLSGESKKVPERVHD